MTDAKMIFFDMDGTLLPMDIDVFTNGYFKMLCKKLIPFGYDPEELIAGVWKGTGAMVKNDGSATNEEVFFKKFSEILGERVLEHKYLFDEFYENEFSQAKIFCGYNEQVPELINKLKKEGFRIAVATNPIFPLSAMEERLRWAGLDPDDFEMVTSYEFCHYSKPNPKYFEECALVMGVDPADCLMVGNDATEDLAAAKCGMEVFLVTDCLINKDNTDISKIPQGDISQLEKFIFG